MFCSRCGTELSEWGVCPKCGYKIAQKSGKKKQIGITAGLIALGAVVVGVGVGWASGKPSGIMLEGNAYQYDLVNPEDIVVEYSGLKPDTSLADYKGTYVTDSARYMEEELGIYLDGEYFSTTIENYIPFTDINWSWGVSDRDMYSLYKSQLEVSESLFEGTLSYVDGAEVSVKPDSVDLVQDDSIIRVSISFMDKPYIYEIPIKSEWDNETIPEDELQAWYENLGNSEVGESSAEAVSSSTVSSAEKGYEVFSEEVDAPGLSAMDWDLFNEIFNEQMSVIQGEDIQYEGVSLVGVSGHDLFKRVSNDPRTDWSLVSENFSTYYGNTDDGISNFIAHLVHSYVSGYSDREFSVATDEPVLKTLSIQPMYEKYFIDEEYSDIIYVKEDEMPTEKELAEEYVSVLSKGEEGLEWLAKEISRLHVGYLLSVSGAEVNDKAASEVNSVLGCIKYVDEGVKTSYPDLYSKFQELVMLSIQEKVQDDEGLYSGYVSRAVELGVPSENIPKPAGSYEELISLCDGYKQ